MYANRRQPLLLLLLAFAASLLIALPYVQCLGDDTFIYMRQIDNVLSRGKLEYNLGEPCYGMTSVTWFFSWVAAKALLGDMDWSRYVISLLAHVLAFVGIHRLAGRLIRNPLLVLVVTCAVVFDPFYVRWFWSGWEMAAKVAAAAWALVALIRCADKDTSTGFVFLSGVLLGVGILTRPEMLVMAGFGAAYLVLTRPGRIAASLLAYAAGIVLVTVPWLLYAQHTFGWMLPHTIYAKGGAPIDAGYILASSIRLGQIMVAPHVALLALAAFFLWRVRPSFLQTPPGRPLAFWRYSPELLSFLMVLGWGAVVFGYVPHGTYIESQKTGLFTPFLLIALAALAQAGIDKAPHQKAVLAAVLACELALSLLITTKLFHRYDITNPAYAQGEDEALIAFSKEVKTMTSPQDKIGLWELGVVGYYSERYIVDFVGLGTPDLVRYKLRYGGTEDNYVGHYLADHGGAPSYIVHTVAKDDPQPLQAPRPFFGSMYTPVLVKKVHRIGGRETDNYYHYVLFKKDATAFSQAVQQ